MDEMRGTMVVSRRRSAVDAARDAALIGLGAISLAGLSQVAIPLPWTPVPVTLQVLGALLLGGLLGARRGATATAAYVAMGACGLPVFAAGASLPLYVAAGKLATLGYLLALAPAAWAVGAMCERAARGRRGALAVAGAMALGVAMIYAGGWLWLAVGLRTGAGTAWLWGVLPFIAADAAKAAIATAAVIAARRDV